MRLSKTTWKCDPSTNTLHASINLKGGLCQLRVGITNLLQDIQRLQSYIKEQSAVEVRDVESEDKQNRVSIVS